MLSGTTGSDKNGYQGFGGYETMGKGRWPCAWGSMHVENNRNERKVGLMGEEMDVIGEYEIGRASCRERV